MAKGDKSSLAVSLFCRLQASAFMFMGKLLSIYFMMRKNALGDLYLPNACIESIA